MTSPTPAEHTARPKSRSIAAIQKLIDDFFSPWGSWKTAWWEMEVGDSDPFHPNALLREIHKRLDGPDWERLYLRDMEAIADLVGKPDMSRLYDVLQAAVNERASLLERVRVLTEALSRACMHITNTPHDEHCFTNDPNPDACRCVCGKDMELEMAYDVLDALQPEQETAK